MQKFIFRCLMMLIPAMLVSVAARAQAEKRPCQPSDIPKFLTEFKHVFAADSTGALKSIKGKSVFESDDYFVYQKKLNGEFTTYLINAEEFCEALYENDTLSSMTFSVFLWDTPIERNITIYINNEGKVEKLVVSYPKEEMAIKETIFTNR